MIPVKRLPPSVSNSMLIDPVREPTGMDTLNKDVSIMKVEHCGVSSVTVNVDTPSEIAKSSASVMPSYVHVID